MLKIIGYKQRQNENGEIFNALLVQGGVEMVKSENTGQFYATARKSSMISTFDEATCKALVGTDLPGSIKKENCAPYEYTIKTTGEVIQLKHKYVYYPEVKDESEIIDEMVEDLTTFNKETIAM